MTSAALIRRRRSSASLLSLYSALGIRPELAFDFANERYFTSRVPTTFSDAITHTRASTATYVDNSGVLQTAASGVPRVGHHVWNGSAWVNEGLLHESEARTNSLPRNNTDGAIVGVIGSGGAPPTGMILINNLGSGPVTTVEATGTELGMPYMDIRWQGTATGTPQTCQVLFNSSSTVAASSGQTWTVSSFYKLVAGSFPAATGSTFRYGIVEQTGGSFLTETIFDVSTPDANIVRNSHTSTLSNASTDNIRGKLEIRVASGAVVDVTIRYYMPQLEQGATPSSPILTSGSAVTRAADVLTIPSANLPWPSPVVIGPEIATGAPDTIGSDWTDNGDGSYTSDGTQTSGENEIRWNDASIVAGRVFKVSGTVSGSTTGNLGVRLGAGGYKTINTNDDFEFILADAGVANVQFAEQNSFDGTISNLSVREINPLAVSIQMDGAINYADTDQFAEVYFWRWFDDANNQIYANLRTNQSVNGGRINFWQTNAGVASSVVSADVYTPGVLVPYDLASRNGSTFINGAIDGTALTANTTPVALADLSASDLNLGFVYNGTIKTFRIWANDVTDAGLEAATT